jgi:single-stranded DNA-binding protein
MNTVKIVGTLPRKPFIPATEDGKQPVALFTVACRHSDIGGPNFIEVKAFGEEAQLAANSLTDRTKVEIIGHIQSESWTSGKGKNAKRQYRQIVVADYLKVLDGALAPDQADQPADTEAA